MIEEETKPVLKFHPDLSANMTVLLFEELSHLGSNNGAVILLLAFCLA
jgi:hypothetical protein